MDQEGSDVIYYSSAVAERRWRVLDFLELSPGHSLNEDVLRSLFRQAGFLIDVTELRSDLTHLDRHHCVRLHEYVLRPGRYLLVATLTAQGQQTWRCERPVPGVAERKPL